MATTKFAVYANFSFDGKRYQFTTGISVHPSQWKNGQLKHQWSHQEWHQDYVLRLEDIKRMAEAYHPKLSIKGITHTKAEIQNHITRSLAKNGKTETKSDFSLVYDEFLKVRSRRKTREQSKSMGHLGLCLWQLQINKSNWRKKPTEPGNTDRFLSNSSSANAGWRPRARTGHRTG